MAVKIALESFLAVVKRSNLVAADQLQPLLKAYQRQPGRSNDARQFADVLVEQKILTPWQAEKLLQGKHKGFFLGKYRLLSLVGKGGMSTVYLAEHVLMRRLCAIKVLPTRRLQNASYLARFHREAQAVASLDHRNIVRAYDVDHESDGELDIHFLVMEYVEGKGLLDLVLSAPHAQLPPVVAAEYIRQAALGLQHAHVAGLVHRDVKPGNLIIDLQGTVKVLDLGLARFFESGEENSLTVQHDERVLGTADYLAPEQAVDSHNVDARADIYSLGCTLYLCLTGQPPFTQGSLAQRLLAHQTREPPTVESIQPLVPTALAEIVRKMMAKDPANRYQTAGEVATVLEAWLKTTPKTDFDRTFAGLDRLTPTPAERRADSAPASRADTVRPGSRADASSTPLVERRRKEPATPADAPRKSRTKSSPSVDAIANSRQAAAESRSAQIIVPLIRRDDQETTIGGPPVPPPSVTAKPLSESVRIDFGGDPFDVGEPVSLELPGNDESSIIRRNARQRPSPLATWLAKIPAKWPATIRAGLQSKLQKHGQQTRAIWGAVGVGAVVVLVFLVWALLEPAGESNAVPPPIPNPIPETIVVVDPNLGPDLKVAADGELKTIGAALDYVRDHRLKFTGKQSWTIKVAGGKVYEEAIHIRNTGGDSFPNGVVIESDGPSPAVLRPAGKGPVIELDGVERLTLRGFALDGGSRDVVVHLAGFLVGTHLENLEFRDVGGVGVTWQDVSGLTNAPVQLSGLRFFGRSPTAVAVRMGDVRQMKFDKCRFIGPFQAAIELTSSVWNADVSIRRCVFHDVQTGVHFLSVGQIEQDVQRVELVNNTFHQVQRGLVWDAMPQAGSSRLTVHHNLFLRVTETEAVVTQGYAAARAAELLAPGSTLNNWTDRPAPTDAVTGLELFAAGRRGIQAPAFASTDPTNADFLKPTSPSVVNELNSAAQGADPIVGAVAP